MGDTQVSDRIIQGVSNKIYKPNPIELAARVKPVRASRGKLIRAEPVAELYEEGKVHHVGYFDELEEELTEFSGGRKSPNRLDALVWGITELSQNDGSSPNVRQL